MAAEPRKWRDISTADKEATPDRVKTLVRYLQRHVGDLKNEVTRLQAAVEVLNRVLVMVSKQEKETSNDIKIINFLGCLPPQTKSELLGSMVDPVSLVKFFLAICFWVFVFLL